MLFVENVMLTLVFLNALVTALVSFPMYVSFTQCIFLLSLSFFSIFAFFLYDKFLAAETSYPLLCGICCSILFPFSKFLGKS